jgi:hypothetical protein
MASGDPFAKRPFSSPGYVKMHYIFFSYNRLIPIHVATIA